MLIFSAIIFAMLTTLSCCCLLLIAVATAIAMPLSMMLCCRHDAIAAMMRFCYVRVLPLMLMPFHAAFRQIAAITPAAFDACCRFSPLLFAAVRCFAMLDTLRLCRHAAMPHFFMMPVDDAEFLRCCQRHAISCRYFHAIFRCYATITRFLRCRHASARYYAIQICLRC